MKSQWVLSEGSIHDGGYSNSGGWTMVGADLALYWTSRMESKKALLERILTVETAQYGTLSMTWTRYKVQSAASRWLYSVCIVIETEGHLPLANYLSDQVLRMTRYSVPFL